MNKALRALTLLATLAALGTALATATPPATGQDVPARANNCIGCTGDGIPVH